MEGMEKFSKVFQGWFMKNSRLITALLAATLIISCAPVQAKEPKGHLSKLKKTLDDSLDRFKRCIKREKCTRKEKLKVVRDALAVLALVGGGWYLAKRYLPMLHPRTISDEKFSHIITSGIAAGLPEVAKEYLRKALTERNDDYLAMFWIGRILGTGRIADKDWQHQERFSKTPDMHSSLSISGTSPLLQAVNNINYDLAENILKLAVSSADRPEGSAELIKAIMNEKRSDPLFQITYLLARRNGSYYKDFLPDLNNSDSKSEISRILVTVNQDPEQIRRLKNFVGQLGMDHWQIDDIIITLVEWVKKH